MVVRGHPSAPTTVKYLMPKMNLRLYLLVVFTPLVLAACTARREAPATNMRTLPVETLTVKGVLVDTWCYSQGSDRGTRVWPPYVDTACSNQSMKLGYPVAVVVDTDSVWVLSESPRIFAKFLNDSVRVVGDIRSDGVLIPRAFDRKSSDKWQGIF